MMRLIPELRNFVVLAGLMVWLGNLPAASDEYLSKTLRELQRVLKAEAKTKADQDRREKALEELSKKLQPVELRAALALDSWKDEKEGGDVAAIDTRIRNALVARFKQWVADDLVTSKDPTRRQAAAVLIGEIGTTIRGSTATTNLARELTGDLVKLVSDPDPAVRHEAARAVGQINPEADKATLALGKLLASNDVADRRAAADGLDGILRIILPLTKPRAGTVAIPWRDQLQAAQEVTAVLGNRLPNETDRLVWRSSLDALRLAAGILGDLVEFPPADALDVKDDKVQYRKEYLDPVQKLTDSLAAQLQPIAAILADPNEDVRVGAARALTEIGYTRRRLLSLQDINAGAMAPPCHALVPVSAESCQLIQAEQPSPDVLGPAFAKNLDAIKQRLKDPDSRVRLAALETLTTLGPLAVPVVREAAQVLRDSNPFVRWAGARLLERMGVPPQPEDRVIAVRALIELLGQHDIDVHKAAASALGTYGGDARLAVPALSNQIENGESEIRNYLQAWPPAYGRGHSRDMFTDPENRVSAINALQSIGIAQVGQPERNAAIRALELALENQDARVREAAAVALGQFGPLARSAAPALVRALTFPDVDPAKQRRVRQAASDALLAVTGGSP